MKQVELVCKRLILFILLGAFLPGPLTARAASYRQALEDYSEQHYSRSYKKAMSLAREKRGEKRGKALILAAAAVLELDREEKARVLFKKALESDPDLELPDVVRSRRAQRFFADVRDGRDNRKTFIRSESVTTAFDRLETYLPLGLNQLYQGKAFLGLTFGGVQAFGAYYAYAKSNEATKAEQQAASLRRKAIQTGDDINPVFLDLVARNKSFVKRSRQTAQLSLITAFAAYGGSVLEAGYRAPLRMSYAIQDASSYPLFAMDYRKARLQFEIFNPLLSSHGVQLSLHF
jgi:tetratricopeptide (TPR) repeat protein